MNSAQRKQLTDLRNRVEAQSNRLASIVDDLDTPIDEDEKKEHDETIEDVCAQLEDINIDVEQIKDDEEEKFGNMPEGLQASDNGQKMEAAAEALSEAFSYIESAVFMLRSDLDEGEDLATRLSELQQDDLQLAIDQIDAATD
jgi:hypothetical protein